MIAPWFSSEVAPFFSMFSLLAAVAAVVPFAERGVRRTLVRLSYYGALGVGLVLLAAAAVGYLGGQPRYVVATLALTGVLVVTPLGFELPRLTRLYRDAELRSTIASDL